MNCGCIISGPVALDKSLAVMLVVFFNASVSTLSHSTMNCRQASPGQAVCLKEL